MSFYIRKSVKFGPIRLNFSKSGVGISAGITGARISTGPRGTYIHMGRYGVYYRQRIDGSLKGVPLVSQTDSGINGDGRILTANVDDLVESSNKDLLSKINSRIQQPTYAFKVGVVSTMMAGTVGLLAYIVQANSAILSDSVYPIILILLLAVATIIWITGLSIAWVTNKQENLTRTTTLRYKLDDDTKAKYIAVQKALAGIAKSARIWRVTSRIPNWNWKRDAGAQNVVSRNRIEAGLLHPPFIQTSFKVYGIKLDSMQLYFLPDQVLIFQDRKYGAVSYNTLKVNIFPSSFVEGGYVPSDATVIDHTWQYVRKDGGPDRRFKNNRQIPVVHYGQVELSSQSGLNLQIHVSNLAYAQQFAQSLSDYIYLHLSRMDSNGKGKI